MDKTLILGAGTYGEVYSAYINDAGTFDIIGFLDDDENKIGKRVNGIEVLDKISNLEHFRRAGVESVIIPIGNNEIRCMLFEKATSLGFKTPNFIHPAADMHRTVEIGDGVYILPGTRIMPFAQIGNYNMISMGVNIAHHTRIHPGCFFSQCSNIGASIEIEEQVFVGIASTIMTGTATVGEKTIIGAGAVVTDDLPARCTAVGVPAKPIKFHDREEVYQ